MADHTKVGLTSLTAYGEWPAGVTLVTDAEPAAEFRGVVEGEGAGVVVA